MPLNSLIPSSVRGLEQGGQLTIGDLMQLLMLMQARGQMGSSPDLIGAGRQGQALPRTIPHFDSLRAPSQPDFIANPASVGGLNLPGLFGSTPDPTMPPIGILGPTTTQPSGAPSLRSTPDVPFEATQPTTIGEIMQNRAPVAASMIQTPAPSTDWERLNAHEVEGSPSQIDAPWMKKSERGNWTISDGVAQHKTTGETWYLRPSGGNADSAYSRRRAFDSKAGTIWYQKVPEAKSTIKPFEEED